MATVTQAFGPLDAVPPAANYARFDVVAGTNFPVASLRFDAATQQACYFFFRAANYGSGNVTVAVDWYADTAVSGDVVWGAALGAVSPDADAQDVETKALAAANTVTDTHLGTTGQRLHRALVTVSNLDALAADDWVCLKLYRDAAAAGDTMAGDAQVVAVAAQYSDV